MSKNFNIFIVILLCISLSSFSQSFNLKYDHTALLVSNLDESAAFYTNILQLKEIETPGNNPILRWFSLGNNHQLHLIKLENDGVKLHKAIHFSLNTTNYDAFLKHLDYKKINYTNWPGDSKTPNVRADGVRQIYLQDPDGHWIEINDAHY